nr:MFS transporter [Amycolatopsis rubida]
MASLGTFAVGFVARPVGAILFGHWGDRISRKSLLVTSLPVMGLSTVAFGLVPDHGTLGIWSPVLPVVLPFVRGIGGEWGGAVLLSTEYAPPGKRGLCSAFPQLGLAIGFVLDNLLFLFSEVRPAVGFCIRIKIAETPVFQAALDKAEQAKVPLFELLRKQPRVLVLSTLSFVLALFCTVTTFRLSMATTTLGIPRTAVLISLLIAATVMGVATLVLAMKSDRWGRRRPRFPLWCGRFRCSPWCRREIRCC